MNLFNFSFWPYGASSCLILYLSLCKILRFRRRDEKHAHYPYKTRDSFASMTNQHAFEILESISSLEFPMLFEKALSFALFKTYGIPTISKLLCQTKELSERAMAPKRYADTVVLISEFVGNAPDSDRTCSAIARMNYLHSIYQKAGKISNNDMLYTLSLFALEPKRWIDVHEWRTLTPMEVCAIGTFWKSIGDAMHIDYAPLASSSKGFHDGLQFMDEMEVWSDDYERQTMVPDKWNKKLANETVAILLVNVPGFAKGPGEKAVAVMMDERLRKAMLYPPPPPAYVKTVTAILEIRKFVLRNLSLPRPWIFRYSTISEGADEKTGRYWCPTYDAEPWYVPNTFWYRWDAAAWLRWMLGRPYPGSEKFRPEGYHIHEVGPDSMLGKGMDEYRSTRDKLLGEGRGGCPFAFR